MSAYTPPPRQAISDAGRPILAAAASLDHDWSLPHSGVDKLIAALADLTDEDLEVAALATHYLNEAVTCLLIQRDMARDGAQ